MKQLVICDKGHRFYKSSTCRSCPKCAQLTKPQEGFLSLLSAPARRAMDAHGISKVEHLTEFTLEQILSFHGVGKTSLPILEMALKEKGLNFKAK